MISRVGFITVLFICACVISICLFLSSRPTRSAAAVTFNTDIAPIIFTNCAACHHPGGSGPFSLLGYQDVKKRAKQIALVTESRYMPPWLPEPGYGQFAGARRLSDEQIRVIQQWVAGGMPEGSPADLPSLPEFKEGWQLGEPDLIVKMPQPYSLPAGGTDVFRNFVIPIPVPKTRYVRAIEILPGNKKLVHHANILIDRTQASRRRDEQDPGVGFSGMDVAIESERFDPDSHFLFWKPGTVPWAEPEGLAWRLDRGTDLVLNMHLQPSGKPEVIQAAVGLYYSDQPPTRYPMLLQLERDGAIDIPPGKKDFVITDDFTLPVDVDVLGVYPHAHYLGKELEGFVKLPDGTKQWLIRIRNWDINWQAVYRYEKPIFLPKGSVISMRYSYDNSADNPRNPSRPPKRVVAGNKSTDEMGHLWIQVLPRTQPGATGATVATVATTDLRIVLQKELMQQRLRKYPSDFTAHFNLGAAEQSEGKIVEAIEHYRLALRAKPGDVAALNGLGVALLNSGKPEEAIVYYRQALSRKPDYADAHYNLGNLLLAQNRPEEAIKHLREVLRLQPEDAGAYNSLGSAFGMQGDSTQAANYFEQSLRLDPDNADVHSNLAQVLATQGKLTQAIFHYEESLRLDPDNADAHNELGVLLANQGKLAQALVHFEQAVRLNPAHANAQENLKRARQRLK